MPVAPALDYGPAVAIVATYLRSALTAAGRPAAVISRLPQTLPAESILITRTGGPEVFPMVDGPMITLDCRAATNPAAETLAQLARRLLHNMAGTIQSGRSVHRVIEVGGPSDLPDPVTSLPRWTLTMIIQLRGVAA